MNAKRGADALRAGLLVGAIVVTVVEPVPFVLIASMALALAVKGLHLPAGFDLAVVCAMAVTGISSGAGLYGSFELFDRMVHFSTLALLAPSVVVALQRSAVLPPVGASTRQRVAGIVLAGTVGLAIGALWEIFEWAADNWAGTTLAHGQDDTIGDLVVDGIGAAVGGVVGLRGRGWDGTDAVEPQQATGSRG